MLQVQINQWVVRVSRAFFNSCVICGEGVKWPTCALAHADGGVVMKHPVSYL